MIDDDATDVFDPRGMDGHVYVWCVDVHGDRVTHVWRYEGEHTTTVSFADRTNEGHIWRVTITTGRQLVGTEWTPHDVSYRDVPEVYARLIRGYVDDRVPTLVAVAQP
jgi:hypothetical protein